MKVRRLYNVDVNIVEIGYSTGENVVEYEGYNFKDNYNIGIISLKRLTIFFYLI